MALDKFYNIYGLDTSAFYFDDEMALNRKLDKAKRIKSKCKKRQELLLNSCGDVRRKELISKQKRTLKRVNRIIRETKAELKDLLADRVGLERTARPEAFVPTNIISTFDSDLARCFELKSDAINEEIIVVQIYFFDVAHGLALNGFTYNGNRYCYFSSSAGQIRTKKMVFVREDILNRVWNRLTCGLTVERINELGGVNPNKTYLKTKKNKKLFMQNLEEDIKENYPAEVYEAFKSGERYAKLRRGYSGIIRIQHMSRKYGLTPYFRALEPLLRLRNLYNADDLNNKAKSKKIICQTMRKEILGNDASRDGLTEMAYAHKNFMSAWRMPTVVVTCPPAVEGISYIEPKVEDIDYEKINLYRSIVMTTLGIGFLNSESDQAFTVATISINQLMAVINKISEQFEKMLEEWYRIVLADNGIGSEFVPKVSIIDAEQTDIDVRKGLVELLYSKLNCSMRTAYETLGFSIEDEKQRRLEENADGYDDIFTPHNSLYTKSGDDSDSEGGRPLSENPTDGDKQDYDRDRRKEMEI